MSLERSKPVVLDHDAVTEIRPGSHRLRHELATDRQRPVERADPVGDVAGDALQAFFLIPFQPSPVDLMQVLERLAFV